MMKRKTIGVMGSGKQEWEPYSSQVGELIAKLGKVFTKSLHQIFDRRLGPIKDRGNTAIVTHYSLSCFYFFNLTNRRKATTYLPACYAI